MKQNCPLSPFFKTRSSSSSKVDQETLNAFGREVKRAVSLKEMTQDGLSSAMDSACEKSMLSKITKGTRETISPRIVGKLIAALGRDEGRIDRFLGDKALPDAEETKSERDADLMIQMVTNSDSGPQNSGELLSLLANTHAEGDYTDGMTVFVGLIECVAKLRRVRSRYGIIAGRCYST